uniref:Transcription factor protein n=1 Tax=Ciona intestinalis TaxID=7719 RepID=Q4H375_CIOIN|nr:transcription factor protein [Ciona intestinalis]BAE06552.1 transcription factor protein [Ciona intestinalis]|eukprot:NP_001071760.1 transcription factor protein [Ciona intestinalis]
MGRKKIQISRIGDERNRQVTFTKRKFGLMKKAYELSVLCDCEIALIIFNSSNKLFQYASTDMDKVLLKYTEYNEPHESRTNADIIEMLNKKDNKNCDSPDVDHQAQLPTPGTLQRYETINKQFDDMINSMRPPPQQDFSSMPVTVPVTGIHPLHGYPSPIGMHQIQHEQVNDPNLLYPHHPPNRRSPLPKSPLARGHSPSRSPSGQMYSPEVNMISDTPSPGGNGYSGGNQPPPPQQRGPSPHMDRTSPMPHKPMQQSPTSPARGHRPGLHVVIPPSRNMPGMDGGNDQLSTPVVSLATPNIIQQYQHAPQTSYNPVDYQVLAGGEVTGFASPGSLLQNWPHQSPFPQPLTTPQHLLPHPSLMTQQVPMIRIKREPETEASPDKDPDQRPAAGRSPMEVMSPYEMRMDDRSMMVENGGNLPVKRQRVESGPNASPTWTT